MSMLNDLKKLLFGAKSVAKSAGGKAVEAGKEAGEEISEKSKEYLGKAKDKVQEIKEEYGPKAKETFDDAKDFAEGLVDEAWKKTGEFSDKARQKARDFFDTDAEEEFLKSREPKETYKSSVTDSEPFLEDTADPKIPKPQSSSKSLAGEAGEKLKSVAESAGKKAADISEKVGKEVLEQGEKAWDKFQDVSEKVGKKILDTSEEVGGKVIGKFNELVDKANEEAAKESLDDTTEKARQANEDLERRIQERGAKSNAENLKEDSEKGPVGGFDSFFDRAKRFAEGDYHNEGGKEMKIQKNPEYKPGEKPGAVKGFEDLDGDGNEIIDDAILDTDDEPNDDVLDLGNLGDSKDK